MVTYVGLLKWTEQGIKNLKDTVKRAEEAQRLAERLGGRVLSTYWTQGQYDVVSIVEFTDEDSANAFALAIGMSGNLRSESLRAFSADDMQRILSKLP
jgi:uncharacterized protein with GYD domain